MSQEPIFGEPRCIAPVADRCGEGVVWHPAEKTLFWTDINRFLMHSWHFETRAITTWTFQEPVTALNLTTEDHLLIVCFASRVALWDCHTGLVVKDSRFASYALPGALAVRCNDARVDAAGRLWVTTMQNNVSHDGQPLAITEGLGELFSIDASGHRINHRSQLGIGNTVAWSPDRQWLYTADTLADAISRFRVHEDGTISDEQLCFQCAVPGAIGLPDGSAIDEAGFLWNCRHGGSSILRLDPNGLIDSTIPLPVKNPTTCIFGGPHDTTLFVTSAAIGDEDNPLAGGLFAIETKLKGLPPNRFALSR